MNKMCQSKDGDFSAYIVEQTTQHVYHIHGPGVGDIHGAHAVITTTDFGRLCQVVELLQSAYNAGKWKTPLEVPCPSCLAHPGKECAGMAVGEFHKGRQQTIDRVRLGLYTLKTNGD